MATRYSTYALSASQSPVSSYKRNNCLVTEGYDLPTAKYWFRLDFGQVREFNSRPEMEAALDAEFAPKLQLPDLSLPQIPAYIPPVFPRDWPEVNRARQRAWVKSRSTKGHVIPSRGVICLPAPRPANVPGTSLAAEVQAVVGSKKAWASGETVWIANRRAFLKESGGFISLDYIPPKRHKFTPPVPVGKVGFLSVREGWKLGYGWMDAVKKAERGLEGSDLQNRRLA